MNAKKLIEENNRKRECLAPENEAYYSDLLIYIRLKFTLSELKSEEVLMELLDHLLDGQKAGKTANDIFGDDPRGFADELIEHLPKEEKRALIPYIGRIIGDILGWLLIIRGVLFLVLSRFIEVDTMVHPATVLVMALAIAAFVIFTIVFLFKMIDRSLFKAKRNTRKETMIAGLIGAGGMAAVLLLTKFLPDMGPSFDFSWWASCLVGSVLLVALYVSKKIKSV
jgi:DNA-binding ferritin-like protein (Dps family)